MSSPDRLDDFLNGDQLGPIFRSFSPIDRRTMMQDDLFAGRSVSAVLLAIVTMGMLLMIGTVLLVT